MRKLRNGTRLEPDALWENHDPGGRETATSPWGVLSGIVLGGLQGEGPDGSTQPAKETRAGHVGLDQHESTSLQGISNRARESRGHRFQNLYQCLNADFIRECWQDLNQDAASGVDGVTAAQYQENLDENIQDLVRRLKTKCYRAKLVRRCYIPKENGKERPLGIPALEDKLVQLACAKLLNAIYEQDFLDFSNGYRPNRSAKETVADLTFNLRVLWVHRGSGHQELLR
jgi:RNA-directed DNA polymerase